MYDYILVPFSEDSEGIVQYYNMDSKPIGIFEDKFRFILSLTPKKKSKFCSYFQ
jgi:hypothetical protein